MLDNIILDIVFDIIYVLPSLFMYVDLKRLSILIAMYTICILLMNMFANLPV